MEVVGIDGAPAAGAGAYAEEEAMQVEVLDAGGHGGGIVPAGMVESQVVVGVPLAYMLEAEAVDNSLAYSLEVVNVLVEEGGLMVGISAGAYGVEYHGDALGGPEAEELTAGLDIGIVEDTAGYVVELAAIDDGEFRGGVRAGGQAVSGGRVGRLIALSVFARHILCMFGFANIRISVLFFVLLPP